MNVLSVCSGAGGMDRGLEAAGMTVAGLCEIDRHARAVLAHHWPDTPIHDDLTTLDGADWHGRIDIVAGGTPCTDLSVAGRRDGLGGEHSRLFWDLCRVADTSATDWVLWENVAGALSSHRGDDFAAVLWGLTGLRPTVPENGWRTFGMCVGPHRTAVWRVLDARWFGVAQRRRRVFVVAGPRALCSLSLLVEPESVPRGARPGSEAREDVAGTLGGGSGGRGWCPDTDRMTFVPTYRRAAHGDYRDNESASTLRTRAGDGTSTDLVIGVSENQLATTTTVRRLTPRECERLMGWPDDWTRYGPDGEMISDAQRYKMCGNGVVSPVAEWIGRRIIKAAG